MRSACGPSSDESVPMAEIWHSESGIWEFVPAFLSFRISQHQVRIPDSRFLLPNCTVTLHPRGFRFPRQGGDQLIALVHQVLPLPPSVRRADRVLAENGKRNRRIAVRD